MTDFSDGEQRWIARLGNLRNIVRQEMIRRQLALHVRQGMTVLDVGCGQGTQAIELAASGCSVTGVEPSADLQTLCRRAAAQQAVDIEVLTGTIETMHDVLGARSFDLVCAHGLLMYLEDLGVAVQQLASCVAPGGLMSVTFRSAHALALRPGLRRQWADALQAFDAVHYTNELGVAARAHRLDEVADALSQHGFEVVEWYGVRVFNDAVEVTLEVPADEDLKALLAAEERAGATDPYRILGSQLHVIARRASGK